METSSLPALRAEPGPALARPRLPASLLRAVEHGEGADWRPPSHQECRDLKGLLASAVAQAEGYLGGATDPVMYRCLASLALTCKPTNGDTEAMWRTRAAEYARLLGHFPSDIWQDACDDWATTPDVGRWYPTTAELHERMQARLVKRQRVAARLRKMAEIADQPEPVWTEPTAEEKAKVSAAIALAVRNIRTIGREAFGDEIDQARAGRA